jgi:xylulokinase
MEVLLGIDLGTSGIRATLLDEKGDVVARTHHPYPPHASWIGSAGTTAEEMASFFYGALTTSLAELIPRARIKPAAIAGIGISAMAPDAVAVDDGGSALSPCILWMDRRAVAEAHLIRRRIGEQRVVRISGNPIDPYYGLCKVLWLKHNLPDAYRRAAKIVSLKDWLVGKLTGRYLTDFSHAGIFGVAFDIRANRWDPEVLRELDLDPGKLPEPAPSDQVVGGVTSAAAQQLGLNQGTPVVNGMIDSAAGYLACGSIEPLESAMTLGTSSCWGVGIEGPGLPPGMNITKTPWRTDLYLVNASLAGGGAALAWLLGLFGIADSQSDLAELEEKAARVPVGSKRLITLPHFLGERAPLWDPDARGLLFGLGPEHSREHLYRSALEGIALSLYRNKLLLENADIHLENRVVVTGGSARSRLFRRILADALGMRVEYLGEERGGDYAAAWLAAKAVGITSDYKALRRKRAIVAETRPEAESHLRYRELYAEIFADLYPMLKQSYGKLAAYSQQAGDAKEVER